MRVWNCLNYVVYSSVILTSFVPKYQDSQLICTEPNFVPTQIFSTVETNFKMYHFWVMNHVNVQAKVSHIEWVAQGPVLVGGRWLLCTTPSAAKCLAHGTLAVMRWGASLPLHLPAALMIHPRYYRYCTIS